MRFPIRAVLLHPLVIAVLGTVLGVLGTMYVLVWQRTFFAPNVVAVPSWSAWGWHGVTRGDSVFAYSTFRDLYENCNVMQLLIKETSDVMQLKPPEAEYRANVLLRNKGRETARDIVVQFYPQAAALTDPRPEVSPPGVEWTPITETRPDRVTAIRLAALPAGDSVVLVMKYRIPPEAFRSVAALDHRLVRFSFLRAENTNPTWSMEKGAALAAESIARGLASGVPAPQAYGRGFEMARSVGVHDVEYTEVAGDSLLSTRTTCMDQHMPAYFLNEAYLTNGVDRLPVPLPGPTDSIWSQFDLVIGSNTFHDSNGKIEDGDGVLLMFEVAADGESIYVSGRFHDHRNAIVATLRRNKWLTNELNYSLTSRPGYARIDRTTYADGYDVALEASVQGDALHVTRLSIFTGNRISLYATEEGLNTQGILHQENRREMGGSSLFVADLLTF